MKRYGAFFAREVRDERRTWYESQFPDNYEPAVLFLVPTAEWAASLNEVLARELEDDGVRKPTVALAVTAPEAAARLKIPVGGAGPAAPAPGARLEALPSPRPPATMDELALLIRYAVDCTEVIREGRRERLLVAMPQLQYPPSRAAFEALVARLTTSEGTEDRPGF